MKLYDEDNKIDFIKEPMFLGEGRNLQRYDEFKYKFFYDMGQKMDQQFWKPAEVSLTKDKLDFSELDKHENRIFTLNLKRQEILDSLQGRAPILTFGRITTLPELEYCITRIGYQETNHSDAYAYILKNVYDNSTKVFDEILDDKVITKHTKNIAKHYEELYKNINIYESNPSLKDDEDFMYKFKKSIYLALISWNILEGIRFYVSFSCTFAFAENKKMEGNAKELKLIARDENIHLAITQKMINILRKEKSEGFSDIIEDCEDEVIQLYKEATVDEIEWADYLFEEGSIIGLNSSILKNYMMYITNTRMRAIGLPKMFEITNNPLPWIGAWLGESKTEVLPQETEITEYQIGNLSNDVDEDDWK